MSKAKYQQIIDDILLQIQEGKLESGMKLPTQRSLASQYNVNRSTVIQALEILHSYGTIESKPRKGMFITDNKWNTYLNDNIQWQSYISHSTTKNNQYFIQRINELEFKPQLQRLSTGELNPNLIPNSKFQKILSECSIESLNSNYEYPLGNLKLREAIVNHVQQWGIQCTVDQVCITSGALQGLKLIADGLLVPKSDIIIETPSYINSIRTWHNIRAKLKALPISTIKKNINHIFNNSNHFRHSLFYTIPTCHNPTQNNYTNTERMKIVQQCQQQGIPIVEDDVYGELYFHHQRPQPLKSLDKNDNILYLGSLSKTVSPGLRIGWIIGKTSVISHLADLKMQNDYGASSISQFIAAQWLANPQYHHQHIQNLKEKLLIKRDQFLQSLNKYFNQLGSWDIPTGSFYIWFNLYRTIDMKQLFDLAVQHNILINPGEIYSVDAKQAIRFSYAYIEIDKIDHSLKILSELIIKLQNIDCE
ncbi:PLP-dependent aminotransferase family protein [Staphylococcus sp. ACRSN]|uniref:aminotransferase-like domain-containing protein n=1 Tax=Staphylococcus sp. ACRSN TaxID=2918214 RepID=UPI001EF2E79E|nr:PLP-dependent aminotransferase family protein [Staphylococcus sp. ACRSN]MCG7339782.1 PLP-dependent aminotransferase family protein [Staphylococcus sp. ACRSN]